MKWYNIDAIGPLCVKFSPIYRSSTKQKVCPQLKTALIAFIRRQVYQNKSKAVVDSLGKRHYGTQRAAMIQGGNSYYLKAVHHCFWIHWYKKKKKWCDSLTPLKRQCLFGKCIDSRSEMDGGIQAPEGFGRPGRYQLLSNRHWLSVGHS